MDTLWAGLISAPRIPSSFISWQTCSVMINSRFLEWVSLAMRYLKKIIKILAEQRMKEAEDIRAEHPSFKSCGVVLLVRPPLTSTTAIADRVRCLLLWLLQMPTNLLDGIYSSLLHQAV